MTTLISNDSVLEERTAEGGSLLTFPADTFIAASYFPPVSHGSGRRTFLDEKNSFMSMLPTLRWRHPGQYVAVAGGQVVEGGASRNEVTRRYFDGHRRGPVCIGFVGPRKAVRQLSPFRARPNASLP